MKIIAIVVTYNGMKWYNRCFGSLRHSSVPVQTIAVDNQSSDGTVEYLKEKFPEVHLIESPQNLGFGKANNIGFKYAIEQDADYIFLLNQDAWVKPDTIERLAAKMDESPQYGILSPVHINGAENELDFNFSYFILADRCPNLMSDYVVKKEAEDRIYPAKFVNAALWLISRRCLNIIGGFDPLFPHYGEDENYVERLEYHGFKLGIYPKVFGIHDRHKEQWQKNITYAKKKNKKYVASLIILTNISQPFYKCYFRVLFPGIGSFLKNLLRLKGADAFIDFVLIWKIAFGLLVIYQHRQMSKNKNCSFLQ